MLIERSMHLIEGNLGNILPAKGRSEKRVANNPTPAAGEEGVFEIASAVDQFSSFFFPYF